MLHGQLDVDLDGTGVGTTAQSQILANPTLKAQADDGYTNALTYMTINTTIKPFDNQSCRQAVEYAVDKTTVQSAQGGALGGGDIASTLLTETVLDIVLATLIFLWALTQGVLPSLHVLPNLPSFDWGWLIAHTQAVGIDGDLHDAVGGRVPGGVVEQVVDGSPETLRDALDRDRLQRGLERHLRVVAPGTRD